MAEEKEREERYADIRREAERVLAAQGDDQRDPAQLSAEETHRLIHELRVHQIELEVQNEELRRAQLALQATQDRYANLYDFAPVGYVTWDNTGLIQMANLTAADLLGVGRRDLVGQPFSRFVFREDQDILYRWRQELLQGRPPASCELRLVRADGTWFHALLKFAVEDHPSEDLRGGMAFTDISELKAAQEALQKARQALEQRVAERTRELWAANEALQEEMKQRAAGEALIRSLLESTEDFIYQVDPEGRYLFSNPRHLERLGLSFDEILERRYGELHGERETKAFHEKLKEVVAAEESLTYEYESQTDGRFFLRTLSPLSSSEKGIYAITIISKEITQRVAMEKALLREHEKRKALSGQLIELMENDRREIAMDLHDNIGQTLTSLKMDLEQMERLLPQGGNLLPLIRQTEIRAIRTIEQIKGFSQKLRPSVLDRMGLKAALQGLIEDVEKSAGLKVAFYWRDVPGDLNKEMALNLFRITQEALHNVIKHAHARNAFAQITCWENQLLLTVEDDGMGFDLEAVKKSASPKGLLGLRIMEERTVQMNGEFTVDTQPGEGTEVLVQIPF